MPDPSYILQLAPNILSIESGSVSDERCRWLDSTLAEFAFRDNNRRNCNETFATAWRSIHPE